MAARLLDGVAVANEIRGEVRPAVAAFTERMGRPPGLGIVLVGDDPASEIYVRNKLKAAGEAGIRADLERLPATASLDALLAIVRRLNESDAHDAILVQSPLPEALGADAERRVFDGIAPDKDVDGFHPANVGRLVQNRAAVAAGTPSGIIELLERSSIAIAGARAVVIGRSDIVGKPMAHLLMQANATVTICHSHTRDLPRHTLDADILVAAVGVPAMVSPDMVKAGAVVIDVGINRTEAGLVGDVDPGAEDVAAFLTPVPGGVGPMTIACLLQNAVRCARYRRGELAYPR
jgi:methylenetetrahydrofolate dehydrogenase (NADP+)/methenyltetrahydrofolate cyclohydrolase